MDNLERPTQAEADREKYFQVLDGLLSSNLPGFSRKCDLRVSAIRGVLQANGITTLAQINDLKKILDEWVAALKKREIERRTDPFENIFSIISKERLGKDIYDTLEKIKKILCLCTDGSDAI